MCALLLDLPTIETVAACALSAANGKPDQPDDGENNGSDPQEMHSESGTKKDQNNQQCKYEYHATSIPYSRSPETLFSSDRLLLGVTSTMKLRIVDDNRTRGRRRDSAHCLVRIG